MKKQPYGDPSLNALKHGGRSKQLLVGEEEKQEDFDALHKAWWSEFAIEGQSAASWVERLVLNDWLLARAERNYLDAEAELAGIPVLEWTLEQHHKLQLFSRYKTTAERAASRFYNMLCALRKARVKEELDLENIKKRVQERAKEWIQQAKDEMKPKEPGSGPGSGAGPTSAPEQSAAGPQEQPTRGPEGEVALAESGDRAVVRPSEKALVEREKQMIARPRAAVGTRQKASGKRAAVGAERMFEDVVGAFDPAVVELSAEEMLHVRALARWPGCAGFFRNST